MGSGSNLLVADAGVPGLFVKLNKDLSKIELDLTRNHCGSGARLPSVSARAASFGLTSIDRREPRQLGPEVQSLGRVEFPSDWKHQ